ncbi:MAG: hypothetical protein P8K09_03050 [Hyphomicrobiales bacterium]|nr:hypothetical protein [Hyphomicrobiales bacterium]
MKYLKRKVLITIFTLFILTLNSNAFFGDDMMDSLTKSLEEATKELSKEMNNLSIDTPVANEDVAPDNTSTNNDSYLFAVPNMNMNEDVQGAEKYNEVLIPADEQEEVTEQVAITKEVQGIFTPMGRDIERVTQYDNGQGSTIIMDMALFMNKDKSMFTEDIDGNLSFDAETVTVGLYLPQAFKDEGVHRNTMQVYESIYDTELNDMINDLIIENVQKLQPDEYFNFKPYKFETNIINIQSEYYAPFRISDEDCYYNKIMESAPSYNFIVAPVSCFYYGTAGWAESGFDYAEFYSREEFVELVMVEKRKKEKEYQMLVETNPNRIAWLDLPPAEGADWGNTCYVEGLTRLQVDTSIIDRWEDYYTPISFSDINTLFIEVTQRKENNCNDLLLTLANKERLKKALDKKTIAYKDDKTVISEEIVSIEYIDNFYEKVSIKDELFYNFFADYKHDDVLFEKLLENNINTQEKLDLLISNAIIDTPNFSISTNQQIYDYLVLQNEASSKGMSVNEHIAEKDRLRLQAEAETAEQNRIAQEQYVSNYPYYAKISCNIYGNQYSLVLCFNDSDYGETSINLEINGQKREKKFFNFTDLGYYDGETLIIDLPRSYDLTAQNVSDNATLVLEIYDQATNQLIESDEASNTYGMVSSYVW